MALTREYFELTKKYKSIYGENTLLLMQVGSFYEVYGKINRNTGEITGSNITDFSKICELVIANRNTNTDCEDQDMVMAGFKDFLIEKYLRKIQEAGYTAVVYDQDAPVKNTTRSCSGIYSPGTYFSNDSTKLTNNITCIWIEIMENVFLFKGKHVLVGIANIDIYTGKTSIFQFKEIYINNPTTYDELERFISIYNPSEAIIISNIKDEKEVDSIINYAGIQCSIIHKIHLYGKTASNSNHVNVIKALNCEKQTYQKEILTKFYTIYDYDVFIQNFYDNIFATQAFCYLLDFVYQHNPHLVNKISEPIFENFSSRLILANHTLKQLNMIDDNNYTGKYSSVLKILDLCLTPMGKRKFAYQLLNPTTDITYLNREYNITEYYLNVLLDKNVDNLIKTNLSCIKDISKIERQIFLKKLSPASFYTLYKNTISIREIYNTINSDTTLQKYFYYYESNIENVGKYCDEIITFIEKYFNIDLIKDISQSNSFDFHFMNEGIDKELDEKANTLFNSERKLEAIRDYLSGLISQKEKKKSTNYVSIEETLKNTTISLLSTKRRTTLLQDALPNTNTKIVLDFISKKNIKEFFEFVVSKKQFEFAHHSASNYSITDNQINELSKNITSTKLSLREQTDLVYAKCVKQFEEYQNHLERISNFVTLFDILYCKCNIARKYNYCKPEIIQKEKSFLNAKNLRHCLIERLQSDELYVANDVILGDGIIDGILLYGTNAVGKTSLIKSIGIAVILAQSGLFVPCSQFSYSPYKYIFSRIIGNDNIFKGLSTFEVEMSELRTILRLSDQNSLILGDELCSGTENTSAISIFVTGIQHFQRSNSSFIFATHLHEIVDYEEITDLKTVHLKHMEVIYDKANDVLVYDRKLRDGPGNSMYGLEVCKSLNLPEDFLQAAYNLRLKYNQNASGPLSLKTSHFNSKKVVNLCEKCGKNFGSEVHHLQHQNNANDGGIIELNGVPFNKNNLANLLTVCESCHNELHKTKKQHKKVKTSKGFILKEI
jgi:DNA mismatch repair protein MutS